MLRERTVRGAAHVLVGGQQYTLPFSAEAIAASPLVPAEQKAAAAAYYGRLMTEQPADLTADLAYDGHDAETELAPLGVAIRDCVMRPLFEGPFYTRLGTLSAAMMRAWLRVLLDGVFYQV